MKRALLVTMMAAALCLGLLGCGESSPAVKITTHDGEIEEFTAAEFGELNSEALASYKTCYVEMVGEVSRVSANSSLAVGDCEGVITLKNGTEVGYPQSAVDLVSSLKEGDEVKITGYVLTTNGEVFNIAQSEHPIRYADGFYLEESPLTIEKL